MAETWDNIGLQVGDPKAQVDKILLTLDLTEAVIDEAVSQGAQVIFSHHPLIFKAWSSIRLDHPDERLAAKLIKNNIALFSAHTNLDSAANGVNQILAELFELSETAALQPAAPDLPAVNTGLGRVGNLTKPLTLRQLAELTKQVLAAERVKLVGRRNS